MALPIVYHALPKVGGRAMGKDTLHASSTNQDIDRLTRECVYPFLGPPSEKAVISAPRMVAGV